MSAAGEEIERRVQERLIDRTVADVATSWQLREKLGFAGREIHPMERPCDGGLTPHPLGPVFYGVPRDAPLGKRRRYRLVCPACYAKET